MFKAVGAISGLYREDQDYNADQAAFVRYRDVWRETQSTLTTLTNNTDDSYEIRVAARKQGVA